MNSVLVLTVTMDNITWINETFNLTFNQNNSDIVSRTYSITVMLFAVALNICCIVVLCKSKSLQENRFYVLTIYLSITDLGTSLAATVMSLWIMSDTSTFAPYACILIFGALIAMIMCAMYQTLLICIHQLFVVFEIHSSFFNKMCTKCGIFAVYTLIHIYVITLYFSYCNLSATKCLHANIVGSNEHKIVLWIDLVVLLLTGAILIIYSIVIGLVVRRHNQVQSISENTAKKLKSYGLTLGIIIVVGFVSVLPASCYSLSLLLNPGFVSYATRRLANNMYLIKPLLDPIIYVFRIRKFRRYLICMCCVNNHTGGAVYPAEII